MRTIKFRGKRLDNGEWVYGDYHRRVGNVHIIIAMEPDEDGKVCYALNQVIPDTVGQFTGLLDKNGKEIYEGDVLSVLYNISLDRKNVCVVYGGEGELTSGFYFSDDGTNDIYHTLNIRGFTYDEEIIGNIHDNPELLKQ